MHDIPYGFCRCGCGQRTKPARQSSTRQGWVRGEPLPFLHGHHISPHLGVRYRVGPDYLVEDRGYETPCWIWQHYTSKKGYAQVGHNGTVVPAHRLYYERHVGPIPEGMQLDHLCRVRCCVNPAHLEPVTNTENLRRGVKTKLTRSQVAEIKAAIRDGERTYVQIGAAFGVSKSAIVHIANGRCWKDVA